MTAGTCCHGAHTSGSAQAQVVAKPAAEVYVVAGIDGEHYTVSREPWQGETRYVVRAFGNYGPDAVTTDATPKGAIQNLNAFHESRGLAIR